MIKVLLEINLNVELCNFALFLRWGVWFNYLSWVVRSTNDRDNEKDEIFKYQVFFFVQKRAWDPYQFFFYSS